MHTYSDFLDILAHREQLYGFFIVWIFMWPLVGSVVVWYLQFTFQILICLLWIMFPFCTFSILHFMLPSSHFLFYFRYLFINLTAIIKMIISEVLTRILLHPPVLCQPLLRRVCSLALITFKLQIIHSQSENRNSKTMIVLPNFSVFSTQQFQHNTFLCQ